jgi:hypothetical protein
MTPAGQTAAGTLAQPKHAGNTAFATRNAAAAGSLAPGHPELPVRSRIALSQARFLRRFNRLQAAFGCYVSKDW